MSFNPNRSLLNSKFEGYKFNPLSQECATSRYNLPYLPSQKSSSTTHLMQPMSFQEVQSRIRHNHLSGSADTPASVYIDVEYRVIAITLDPDTLHPSFNVLYELPQPIMSSSVADHDILRPEYPSAAFLNSSILLVADGHGTLYILALDEKFTTAKSLGLYELRVPSSQTSTSIPFRIHRCTERSSATATVTVILSSKSYQNKSAAADSKSKPSPEFDVWGVNFSLPLQETEAALQMDIQWHRRGEDVPVYTTYNHSSDSFFLFGGSPYISLTTPSIPSYIPTADEIAPIPRRNENLDAADNAPKPPPPYSWTQTSDSLTMAFPLPSTTQKSDIKVTFTPKTLTVLVSGTDDTVLPIPLPRYSLKSLWDTILPSTSFWTWDREGEKLFGLLTLHIDKQHDGTRWSHVFAANNEISDVEVDETLDPSELYNIREALEKYTSSSLSQDTSGLGLGSGAPSLGQGEMDDELDTSVGRTVYVTQVDGDGSQETNQSTSLTLLSSPLPGISAQNTSLVIKSGIDGLVCTLQPQDGTWAHTSTFSALSFVLASKQDTRFTHHTSRSVLAFESGSRGLGFNVYIYQATSLHAQWAKQSVLKIGDSSTGPLVGISAVKIGDNVIILCLCEHELILVRDLPM